MVATNELLAVLDHLESREAELLCWGDSGGHFTIEELERNIAFVLPNHDTDEVEDELRARVMIVPVLDSRDVEIGVRTRMAEAVHLYRNLRQWFHGQSIDQARTLVSDFRFLRRRRIYPQRTLFITDLIASWSEKQRLHVDVNQALTTIVGGYTLAAFQARATERILKAWPQHRSWATHPTATVVCAGTGSGKTLAFYLPVLSSLAMETLRDRDSRVRVLAIYPRKELLKDQFNEAWEQCRKLDRQLLDSGGRKLRIGALFTETPTAGRYALEGSEAYVRYRFLRCPNADCRGEMRWSREDIETDVERVCCHLCGHAVCGDEIALTRNSMADHPPDVLFTTTEMLNQRMSDSRMRHLFGVGVSQAIPVVLLDEVHTYDGTQGAQTAMLLRRWMRLSGNRPHFVGLSATLRDATNFFATLTGTNPSRVGLVEPNADEMEERGAEYLLALRGDPVSQTALLSTTIQAGMLTRRILDSASNPRSQGIWGSKTFLFTDDLDVNNRLYSGLADAEGWQQQSGGLIPKASGPLARLRNTSASTVSARKMRNLGQDWRVAKELGFSLEVNDRARVSRTSSQDAGYSIGSELVVTTASLEVGFNDLDVGAVIQHKAPRGVASYLQRKGRAGRPRDMRPWMLVVLSDFGRDRVAYQQYENLIDPEVKLKALPINNLHILKMHAAQAVLDWLSRKMTGARIWIWFNNPAHCTAEKRSEMLLHVEQVMKDGTEYEELCTYIRDSLAVGEATLNKILWQAPRSICLEFLPTVQRRLASNWAAWSDRENRIVELVETTTAWDSPVPEFISASTFSDLNTPDLHIRLQRRTGDRSEAMSYFQALKEFAPGRVSKRFSIETGALSDWLVPTGFRPQDRLPAIGFEIEQAFGEATSLVANVSMPNTTNPLPIYQPRILLAQSRFADKIVSDTTNAFLRWQSKFLAPEDSDRQNVPAASSWASTLQAITFFTHALMSPLEVIRYNTGSDATIKMQGGQSSRVRFNWESGGRPVGVGARIYVDAARFEFAVSEERCAAWLQQRDIQKAVRVGLFQDGLQRAEVFDGDSFAAAWVAECFLAAALIEEKLTGGGLESAVISVCEGQSRVPLAAIPEYLFQLDREQADTAVEQEITKEQRLQISLKAMLADVAVLDVLRASSTCLYAPLPELAETHDWLRIVLGNTLAAALQQALWTLLPHADENSIIADPVESASADGVLTVWLGEVETGGMGVVSQLSEMFANDPLKVLNAVYRALQPGDYEQMDGDLFAVLKDTRLEEGLAVVLDRCRRSVGYADRLSANTDLRKALTKRGFIVSHTFAAILHSRVLKPGSTAQTDEVLLDYLEQWHRLEDQCNVEIPMNIMASVLAIQSQDDQPRQVFDQACAIQSMLWVRGAAVRQASLRFYNRFQTGNSRTERLLGALMCQDESPTVQYVDDTWLDRLHETLDKWGSVELSIPRAQSAVILRVLASLHVDALDTHGLLLYPRVRSLVRRGDELRVRVELPEAIH